jgi:hypothetical protein
MRLEPCDGIVLSVGTNYIVSDRNCVIQGVILAPAAVSCTVTLYDPAPLPYLLTAGVATTVGAVVRVVLAGAAAGGSVTGDISAHGIAFNNGCLVTVAGTGALATIVSAKI